MAYSADFEKALQIGRPPNIQKLFPNSKALIVSGKVIDRAMLAKGKCMTIAANGRNSFIIRGAIKAAQKANAALIIEIARSESNYCFVNMWNIATYVDAICNEYGVTVPVAVHADHFGIKKPEDVPVAKQVIPTLFDAGITSIAIDASHMPDDQNLLASIAVNPTFPSWAGYECEVGEIKGDLGLSTAEEALFLVKGLNAHDMHPDFIALNNGTTHGIEASGEGINVQLTDEIHTALGPFGTSGAQHGTSGNSYDRLRQIAEKTKTTKANVATALQMASWGVKVNEYGNAELDADGNFDKVEGRGVSKEVWAKMEEYAAKQGWKKGDYKKLNLPFESALLAQPREVRARMVDHVEEFVYYLLNDVFNAADTAPRGIEAILEAGSYDLGPKAGKIEDPADWTEKLIKDRASKMDVDKGPAGDFDD